MIYKGYVDEQDYNRGVCISIPLYQQVFEWFREKFNIDAWSQPFVIENLKGDYFLPDESYSYYIFRDGKFVKDGVDFLDFDDAQLECIKACIKYIKENNLTK